jgi:curved DNA-binding protein CbpA
MDPDNEIMIDNVVYDVYFILGVTSDDTLEHITKEFKRKAKILHPDKMSLQDRNDPKKLSKRNQQFKVLSECFAFISDKKQSYNYNKNKTQFEIINNTNLLPQEFHTSDTHSRISNPIIDKFNDEFTRLKVQTPNDFGYTAERMPELSTTNFEKLKSQYQTETFKPVQLYSDKKFDQKDFNKTFEYHQSQFDNATETALIHKTSDGFNAYNSGFLSGSGDLGCASVSSFNGVMIVGDNFGESGVGYNDSTYSDYKMSFQSQKNPNSKIAVPNDFKPKINKDTPLTQKEIDAQIRLRKNDIFDSSSGPSKSNYKKQEELLLQNQKLNKEQKAQEDREFILKYQHMFDQQTIQDAINKKLITNDDYTDYLPQQMPQQNLPQQMYRQNLPQQNLPQQNLPQSLPSYQLPQNTRQSPQQYTPQLRQTDPRQTDPRQTDPRQTDPRQIDPRYQSFFY